MSVLTSMAELVKGFPTVIKGARTALEACLREGKALKTVTTATTPASGTCAVQFVFSDQDGAVMAVPSAGTFYISQVATGLTMDVADTSIAVLTNGDLDMNDSEAFGAYVTSAVGLLGMTITAAADSYWIVFVQPDGTLLISDECVVNA